MGYETQFDQWILLNSLELDLISVKSVVFPISAYIHFKLITRTVMLNYVKNTTLTKNEFVTNVKCRWLTYKNSTIKLLHVQLRLTMWVSQLNLQMLTNEKRNKQKENQFELDVNCNFRRMHQRKANKYYTLFKLTWIKSQSDCISIVLSVFVVSVMRKTISCRNLK